MNTISSFTKLYSDVNCTEIRDEIQEEISLEDLSKITRNMTLEEFRNTHPNRDCYENRMKDVVALGMFFIHAAKSSNLELTKVFIKELSELDISTAHKLFYMALTSAISTRVSWLELYGECGDRKLKIIDQLLKAGADFNIAFDEEGPDGFNTSLLQLALKVSDHVLVKLLLKHGAQKFYIFNHDENKLIKQEFSEKENEVYKQAKKELRDEQSALLGDNVNVSGRAVSSNQKGIDEVKRLIAENKKQEALMNMEMNVNCGNTLMFSNY